MMTQKRNVVLIGLGRSGTSWAQKVFDYNPNVLSVFEPKSKPRRFLVQAEDQTEAARSIVDTVLRSRTLRAMRKRPIMRKNFHSTPAHYSRIAYMYGASVFTDVLNVGNANTIQVPDFKRGADPVTVTKMVNLVDWLPEMARSSPNVSFVLLIRHPCGYVASNLEGAKQAKMPNAHLPRRDVLDELYSFDRPAEELDQRDFSQRDLFALRWATANHRALAGTQGLDNVHVAAYEDLCEDPIGEFQRMFAACGVDWHQNSQDFLEQSLSASTDAKEYHGLVRKPSLAANRWRETLPQADVDAINEYARVSLASQLFQDYHQTSTAAE